MVLNVDEAIEEMREIELAAGNGVPMENMEERLEVLYRSFVTPTNDDTGYMIIDQINDETKMRFRRFIEMMNYGPTSSKEYCPIQDKSCCNAQ